jgi:hypothetical protein
VAVDRTSKFTFVELVEGANMRVAAAFLEALVAAVAYRTHTALTDNGIQFADLPNKRKGPTARWRGHPFDRVCLRYGIEHRLTKPNHPWTNGQVKRMNRTIKAATSSYKPASPTSLPPTTAPSGSQLSEVSPHSFRRPPRKISAYAFCVGLPGWMWCSRSESSDLHDRTKASAILTGQRSKLRTKYFRKVCMTREPTRDGDINERHRLLPHHSHRVLEP